MARLCNPELFWSRIPSREPDTCWLWTGYRNAGGYGRLRHQGRLWLAHRVAWTLTQGPIPDGLDVLHQCDVPACCNPAHLWVGTDADNSADRERKGRCHRITGPAHHFYGKPELKQGVLNAAAKLTENNIREIRACYLVMANQEELAREYGVSQTTISRIVLRQTWRHIHDGSPL
jgi:predicted DNA-binding protein (UPF0251 family)